MDSLNSDGSGALLQEPLCLAAARELPMRSFTIRTLNRYKRVWEQLGDLARAQGQPVVYSRDLAFRFEAAFGLRDDEALVEGQRWRRRLVFGIKVIDDFVHRRSRPLLQHPPAQDHRCRHRDTSGTRATWSPALPLRTWPWC